MASLRYSSRKRAVQIDRQFDFITFLSLMHVENVVYIIYTLLDVRINKQ